MEHHLNSSVIIRAVCFSSTAESILGFTRPSNEATLCPPPSSSSSDVFCSTNRLRACVFVSRLQILHGLFVSRRQTRCDGEAVSGLTRTDCCELGGGLGSPRLLCTLFQFCHPCGELLVVAVAAEACWPGLTGWSGGKHAAAGGVVAPCRENQTVRASGGCRIGSF